MKTFIKQYNDPFQMEHLEFLNSITHIALRKKERNVMIIGNAEEEFAKLANSKS